MRFSRSGFQTQRSAPSEFRSEGAAFLYRAGYFTRGLELLPLGEQSMLRMERIFARLHDSQPAAGFERLGMRVLKDQETGAYYAPVKTGNVEVLYCQDCGYAAQREQARAFREPFSRENPLAVEKVLTPECSTIAQLAAFLQIPQEKTAKALMFTRLSDNRFVFVVVRGDQQLSEVKLRACVGDVRMASAEEISAAGAVPGYASPVGLKNAFVVVDRLAAESPNLAAGANEPGYHLLNTNCGRDYRPDLTADLTLTNPGEACPGCRHPLQMETAELVVSGGLVQFEAVLATAAELFHDEKGLTLPAAAAPFDVYLMNIPGKTINTLQIAEQLYQTLVEAGISVLLDDRDERAGVKFNDADLIGCPLRVTVGERGWQNEQVELKPRSAAENSLVAAAELVQTIRSML